MKMRSILYTIALASCVALFSARVTAQTVAITIDNPNVEPTPLYTSEMRDKKMLSALKKHDLKVVLFAQGMQVDNQEGRALLQRWNHDGHTIGNHTFSHWSLNQVDEKQYEQDTLKNEKLLNKYSHFKKIFRFPFLKEGDTLEKRDAFREFLRKNHYEFGSVTIDASDWYISDRLEKRLMKNPQADIAPYKKYYLDHLWNRAQYYDNLAIQVLGSSPSHTLLIHHNLLNALFLEDVIQLFKDKGWHVINADDAFSDPVFKRTPNILPAGEGLIWGLAKETGQYDDVLRYPGEDDSYEKDAMDKLGL